MNKIIFITPHLSTGGCPKYLEVKINELLKNKNYDIFVVEWEDITGGKFVVQRNNIINYLTDDNFFTLGSDKSKIIDIIEEINPDIIHIEEISESFIDYKIMKYIWKKDRKWKIVETTHSSLSSISDKIFLPDRWVFPSEYCLDRFKTEVVETMVWEMPIDKKTSKNKEKACNLLNIDPQKIHILNVGLFTPGKNQAELIKISKMIDTFDNVHFHFVGNMADNFKDYWSSIVDFSLKNCTFWGERNDVDLFYEACDIFYFSSTFELNPLVVKEADSWNLPIFMRNLPTYLGKYDENKNVIFLTDKIEYNYKKLYEKIIEMSNGNL